MTQSSVDTVVRLYKKILIVLILTLSVAFACCYGEELVLNNTPAIVCFSPQGGCTDTIVKELNNAKSEILVQAYSFTSALIAKALANAHNRGVNVQVILDKSQKKERYTSATFLSNANIPTFIDDRHAIAHNKIMIIDNKTVITGSFNFTKAAEEKNAENLLVINSTELVKIYIDNWNRHKEHSEKYVR